MLSGQHKLILQTVELVASATDIEAHTQNCIMSVALCDRSLAVQTLIDKNAM